MHRFFNTKKQEWTSLHNFNTRRLVYLALLVSLNIVLTRIASIRIPLEGLETLRIGFGPLPVIMAGFMFGPLYGAMVGVVGDLIGYNINPMGPFLPQFTVIAGLHGLMPPLLLRLLGNNLRFWPVITSIAVTNILTSILLTPFLLKSIFGIPYWTTLPGRIVSQIVIIPLYTVLSRRILKTVEIMKFSR